MMKSIVTDSPVKGPLGYPCLKRSTQHGTIVLFTGAGDGFVVGEGDGFHSVGYRSSGWTEHTSFERFDGEVTLSND